MDQLLSIQDLQELIEAINDYWGVIWKLTEGERYSQESARAYKRLRTILNSHLEKRDGGIISSLRIEDGILITDPGEVESQLLETMREIQVDNRWGRIQTRKFPRLRRLNQHEMEYIVSLLATDKAITYDATSDILFKGPLDSEQLRRPSNLKKTAQKLRNLWRIELDQLQEIEESWAD